MNTHFIIPDIEAADLDSGFNAQIQYTANATGRKLTRYNTLLMLLDIS